MQSMHFPPSTPLHPAHLAFLHAFYAASDTPGAHAEYSRYFTPDAVLVMGGTRAVGREAILALRESMWQSVKSRAHRVEKIFPFGAHSNELMLYGSVEYGVQGGRQTVVEWAARAELVEVEGEGDAEGGPGVQMRFYQVYLNPGAPVK